MWEYFGIGLGFYPPPPPPKKNKTKQNKTKTKKPCIETIRLYMKRRFFKYEISTGIVWYNFKLDFLIHREIWRLNRDTVRWRPKLWNCWSSNSQIHKFFMSLSLQRFLFPATRAIHKVSGRVIQEHAHLETREKVVIVSYDVFDLTMKCFSYRCSLCCEHYWWYRPKIHHIGNFVNYKTENARPRGQKNTLK